MAYFNKGDCCLKLENYTKAIDQYDLGLRIEPNCDMVYFSKGDCYFGLKNYTKAIEQYDLFLKKNPNESTVLFKRKYAKEMINH